MNRKLKLIEAVLNNPRGVRTEDAERVAELIGFQHRKGAGTNHRVFVRPGEMQILNFQDRNGFIKPYQAKQLIEMIEKYRGEWDTL